MWSSGRSEALLEAGLPVPIEIRPIRGAKRLRLRFDETSGTLKQLQDQWLQTDANVPVFK